MAKLKPEDFIKEVRGSAPFMSTVFSRGSCWKFYKILKLVFPEAEPYLIIDSPTLHVVAKIRGHFYDIAGRVDQYKPVVRAFNEIDYPNKWKEKEDWVCNLSHLVTLQLDGQT